MSVHWGGRGPRHASRYSRAALFSPLSLFAASEVGAWYDPSDLSTVWQDTAGTTPAVANDPVGRVDDKSGNGNHLLQGTAANRPLLIESSDLYHLQFDKVNDSMAAAFTIAQPWDRISAIRMADWTSGRRAFDGGGAVAGTLFQTGTTPNLALYDGSAVTAANGGLALATNGVVTERHSGANSRLAINNGTYTTGNPGTTAPGGITLAAEFGGATAFGGLRFLGAVMIDRSLSEFEIMNLRKFFAKKAGVTL